jgi:hypothetical protein
MAEIFKVGSKVIGHSLMYIEKDESPYREGNGFSLQSPYGKELFIQNISYEDFEEICRRKNLYNVEVLVDGDRCYVIDSRIPRDWFRKE